MPAPEGMLAPLSMSTRVLQMATEPFIFQLPPMKKLRTMLTVLLLSCQRATREKGRELCVYAMHIPLDSLRVKKKTVSETRPGLEKPSPTASGNQISIP